MSQRSNKPVIDKAIRYIAGRQEVDGGFKSLSSPSPSFEGAITYQTVFAPALVLGCLAQIDSPKNIKIRQNLADFLLRQKSPHWSFNYWTVDSPQRKTHSYPDDLDDTFCALVGLYLHDPDLIDQDTLVNVVRLLLATETKPGGPYRTWLVSGDSKKVWLDVDLAINCNVAYFLKLTGNSLPTLQEFMEKNLQPKKLESPYYPDSYPILYYLSRTYDGPQLDKLREAASKLSVELVDKKPLKAALLLSSRLRLGLREGTKELVEFLHSSQLPNGSWPAEAFCLDPARDGRTYYNGAAALTTAFAAEALSLYDESNRQSDGSNVVHTDRVVDSHVGAVLKQVESYYSSVSPVIAKNAHPIVSQLSAGRNGAEIIGLPYHFNKVFKQTLPELRSQVLADLSLANLYGWIAYTVYDDFLDDEGRPELLSVANVSMRQSLRYFASAVPVCPPFQDFVYQTFDTIDAANAWELENCRYEVVDGELKLGALPKYGHLEKLAERSLGHALSPLAILCLEGVMPDSPDFRQVQKALKCYLIAKQINDDAHDWQKDFSKGHLTWVVCVILREAGVKPGKYKINDLLPKLQRQFWHHSLKSVCKEMGARSQRGRQELAKITILPSPNILTDLLAGIDLSITDTLNKQRQAKDFLKSYQRLSSDGT
jgi:hypothetical protein